MVVLVALIALAYVLPRVAAYGGVQRTAFFRFADGAEHLLRLDKLSKLSRLDEQKKRAVLQAIKDGVVRPHRSEHRPDGVYRVASLWAGRLGVLSLWTTQLTNGLFSVILVLGIVGLGARLGGLTVGLWGALLAVLCPALVGASWYFAVDYPLAAMVVFGLFLLQRTRGLTCWWACALFALWSSLGLCVKMSYAIYLAGPGVWALVTGLRGGKGRAAVVISALVIAAGSVALALQLQGSSLQTVLELARYHALPDEAMGTIQPLTWAWVAAVMLLAADNFPLPLLLLAAPGLVLLHVRRHARGNGLLLAMVWGTYLLLTLGSHKLERYGLPLYPVLCLLTAWWAVTVIPERWRGAALAGLLAAYLGVLGLAHHHPPPWLFNEPDKTLQPWMIDQPLPGQAWLDDLGPHPSVEGCQLRPALEAVGRLAHLDADDPVVGIAPVWPAPDKSPLYLNIATHAIPHIRDRIIEDIHRLNPDVALPRSVIVVHAPGDDPRAIVPRLKLRRSSEVVLPCEEGSRVLTVALYRAPAGPSRGRQ